MLQDIYDVNYKYISLVEIFIIIIIIIFYYPSFLFSVLPHNAFVIVRGSERLIYCRSQVRGKSAYARAAQYSEE